MLVNGAAGGVGHMAVQLARWKGVRVIAVASGKHDAFVRASVHSLIRPRTLRTTSQRMSTLIPLGGPTTDRLLRTIKHDAALSPVFPLGASGLEGAAAIRFLDDRLRAFSAIRRRSKKVGT